MADITQYTNAIKEARYGEQVRGSIVSAIEEINNEVARDTESAKSYAADAQNQANAASEIRDSLNETLVSTNQLASSVAQAELERQAAETERSQAETLRADAEMQRANAATNYVAEAKKAADDARRLANSDYALLAQSWAKGGTGIRAGEDEDNAEYWAEKVKSIANAGGVVSFKGRGGAVDPATGDYSADMITYNGTNVGEQLTLNTRSLSDLQNIKGVSSFKGRRGEVVPVSGDYTADLVTYSSTKTVKQAIDSKMDSTLKDTFVLKTQVVNNTTSTSTTMPLSANQGRLLQIALNNLNTITEVKTYSSFTAKPSDWLGKGSPFANVDISNSRFSNCPPTRAGTVAFYAVITFGTATRCIQLAFYGFSGASVDGGSIFFRRQHDNDLSGWKKVF